MITNMMELNMNEMEMVNGGTDTKTKAAAIGLSVATGVFTGGAFGSFAGPVGTAVGAVVGGAIGGIGAAVCCLVD